VYSSATLISVQNNLYMIHFFDGDDVDEVEEGEPAEGDMGDDGEETE
jgi:hypothetical protein